MLTARKVRCDDVKVVSEKFSSWAACVRWKACRLSGEKSEQDRRKSTDSAKESTRGQVT